MRQTNKPLPAKITSRWLRENGACENAVCEFERLFPDGITKVTARHVHAVLGASALDLLWLADRVCDRLPKPHPRSADGAYPCAIDVGKPAEIAARIRRLQRKARNA